MALCLLLLKVFIATGSIYILTVLAVKTLIVKPSANGQMASVRPATIRREIRFSCKSVVIFSVVFTGITAALLHGHTRIYTNINEFGIAYAVCSIFLLVFLHDTYFYWTHRLLHSRKLRRIHRIHHLSVVPNPFTALSFHPVEAAIQVLYLPIVVFLLPTWLPVLLLFVYYSSFLMNIVGHCGHELFPKSLARTWMARVANTPKSHSIHHSNGKVNYGLYTHFWDWIMHTQPKPQHTTK